MTNTSGCCYKFIVLLMMDAKRVRNMYSILVVVNKHNTARVAPCWFIIYYRLIMHENSNIHIKKLHVLLQHIHLVCLLKEASNIVSTDFIPIQFG